MAAAAPVVVEHGVLTPGDWRLVRALAAESVHPVSRAITAAGVAVGTTSNAIETPGSGIAGVYYFNPETFGGNGRAVKVAEQKNLVSDTTWKNQNSPELANANAANAAVSDNLTADTQSSAISNPETASADANAKTVAASDARSAPAAGSEGKNGKNKAAKDKQKTQPGEDEVIVKGETVYVGNMKITDERIETPEIIIDENGLRRKKVTVSPIAPMSPFPPLTAEQWKKLTPEQRKKIMVYRQNLPKHSPPPPPSPKPTPKATAYPKTNPY